MKRERSANFVELDSDKERTFHVVTWGEGDRVSKKLLAEKAASVIGRYHADLPNRVVVQRDPAANNYTITRDGLTIGSLTEVRT